MGKERAEPGNGSMMRSNVESVEEKKEKSQSDDPILVSYLPQSQNMNLSLHSSIRFIAFRSSIQNIHGHKHSGSSGVVDCTDTVDGRDS
jgi:hypothetical protein